MQLIETKTLGTAAASIEFTSIPQDGTDLLILESLRRASGVPVGTYIRFNNSTSDFSGRYLYGSGTTPSSGVLARYVGSVSGNYTANTFNSTSIYVTNYSGALNKSFSVDNVTENNATAADQNIISGLWANTSAITSLMIEDIAGTFAIGSTISLYKITKGSGGATVS
jgi:hypothetical protein